MKKIINKTSNVVWMNLKKIFSFFGFQINKNTEKSKIIELIKSLRPYQTNIELIRMGSVTDGGYLVPNDLEGIKTCFSPGVDTESGFEIDCLNRGIQVYMADNSVERPNIDASKYDYNFIKKHIGTTSNEDFITFTDWLRSSNIEPNEDLLMQMDIEGAEYFTLLSIDELLLKQFRVILLEFHFLERLWDKEFFALASSVFEKLLKTHTCVHLHPNNCSKIYKHKNVEIPPVLEFSFLRNDRITSKTFIDQFPNVLDKDNLNYEKPVVLPKNWYKH
ncbi:FkbM family methyltransferase [Mariniflexile gromovii]|uniref:FkbM family methyltransferase n=1 Tax=Mariniflexile gromovii TaxID=362523 RepID=A0ABS4BR19_9FLAO|nr:FkbM family methyltransferase [Mariniflexile gromovii]MBP0902863.1 FkbM family methyltransferase [Mariniflexile gromovii]